jgi:hypothetical protein
MKNIHVLPTEKPSRLWLDKNNNKLHLDIESYGVNNQNIYITSDEEIKEGDYFYSLFQGEERILKYNKFVIPFPKDKKIILTTDQELIKDGVQANVDELVIYEKRVILTTDPQLIADGVQAIDDEFLEWFVKNPSCEEVEVKSKITKDGVWTDLKGYVELPTIHSINYKIIIPKEEPTDFSDIVTKEFFKLMDLKEENKQEPKQELERGITITHVGKQETPTELDSVLAKITHINDLGVSEWYEVVYYADDKWCSYNGSKTFEDGERVIEWKYCKDCL